MQDDHNMQNNQNVQDNDDLSSSLADPSVWDDDDDWNAMVAIRNQVPTVAPPQEAAAAG